MNSGDKSRFYKAVKWLWLLLQAVILPLAAPTIIVLILSAAAAVVVAGVS